MSTPRLPDAGRQPGPAVALHDAAVAWTPFDSAKTLDASAGSSAPLSRRVAKSTPAPSPSRSSAPPTAVTDASAAPGLGRDVGFSARSRSARPHPRRRAIHVALFRPHS